MIFVVGAGLAGLSCALALADAGERVTVLEAAPFAGGRCRSYFDRELGLRLDNGNHLLLSGNRAAHAWLARLGTAHSLTGPGAPLFPFMDLASGARWTLRPGAGRSPLWLFDPGRRVPGTTPGSYLALLRWLRPRPGSTVADVAGSGRLSEWLIEPLAIAALNTIPAEGDAALMAAVVRQTLLAGGAACIPAFPRVGMSESLIEPAIALLADAGASLQLGRRIGAIESEAGRATALGTADGPIALAEDDRVVLAVPATIAAGLLPEISAPDAFEAILNLHFKVDAPPGPAGFLGLTGGFCEWLFYKPGVTSVTISAANRYDDVAPEAAAARAWAEIRRATGVPGAMPAYRVVRERRATFAATMAQNARRPAFDATGLDNLILAGDWTQTGLPATIEGALQSGARAAEYVTRSAGGT